ncbi:MAG: NADH-quinone oxidoreductase subunit NuoG [Motiliproteus sp.]|nr:NADH-quinone oxidoreductase subunit NuoG [Motiliproteus sp.]MCW9052747.1 NADH-quinone oxidoreductase subunit NuoG [Motiliproteus sp.]
MAKITIDGQTYEVEDGQNLLQACLSLGLDLPYFCWHPALGSVGACRQCALIQYQDENDQRGRLIMGCMTPVGDGQILSIDAENAVNFRAGIIEALMTNHPHDCPVCEEGGECHLQDMTVMSGHHSRRYQGLKRTFSNQDLGPFIGHEMNRCITCYRCVRYYRDYAGGTDLHAMASRNRTYFGRFEEGPLESEFSGNLVEVCPTGVFTDKTLSQDYSRKWDLQCAPSVCVHCSLGCNTSPGERYGRLKRIQNRFNSDVNGYFLCDRGRFGYDFVNHPQRPRTPLQQQDGEQSSLTSEQAINQLKQKLKDPEICWIGIGSPRATLESNLALQRLVGSDHFFSGLSHQQEQVHQALLKLQRSGHGQLLSMQEAEEADAIVILGEDISQTAPRLALSVRQAVRSIGRSKAQAIGVPPWQDQAVQIANQEAGHPLYTLGTQPCRLQPICKQHFPATTSEQARLAFAIAHQIDNKAPAVSGLTKAQQQLAEEIAADLTNASRPLLITGAGHGSTDLVQATEQILAALSRRSKGEQPGLVVSFDECNSLGLTLLNHRGQENCLDDAFDIVHQSHDQGGKQIGVIIVENDLYQRASKATVDQFFNDLSDSVVIDYLPSDTLAKANLILPAASFAETQGVLINNEARGQMLFPVYAAGDNIQMSWQWLHASAADINDAMADFSNQAQALRACLETEPLLGALEPLLEVSQLQHQGLKLARMLPRASGRTAMRAHISVHEPKQPVDEQSGLAYTMEGVPYTAMAAEHSGGGMMPASWYPGWNSNQSIHKFQQEIGDNIEGPVTGIKLSLHSLPDPSIEWSEPTKKARAKADHLLLISHPQIFGSDELSALSTAIAERTPVATASLHPDDAKAMQISDNDLVQIHLQDQHIQLPVTINPQQAKRVVLVPDYLDEIRGLENIWVTVRSLGPNPVITSDRRAGHV